MNNEPVAWIYDWGDEQDIKTKLFPNSKAKITPLYTHPANLTDRIAELEKQVSELKYEKSSGVYDLEKTLTDAEQDACFNRGYKEGARDILNRLDDPSDAEILERFFEFCDSSGTWRDFKKAILRKAQEK